MVKGRGECVEWRGRVERTRLCGEREGGECVEWRGRVERTGVCEEREGESAGMNR